MSMTLLCQWIYPTQTLALFRFSFETFDIFLDCALNVSYQFFDIQFICSNTIFGFDNNKENYELIIVCSFIHSLHHKKKNQKNILFG